MAIRGEEEAWSGEWFVHSEDIPLLDALEKGDWHPRTTLLSPFDNLICDRDRAEQLFDFYFRLEIYTPKEKRQYGYYVLPILHGEQLIGRADLKLDRSKGKLRVIALFAEENAPLDATTGRAITGAFERLATFVGAESISYPKNAPAGWKVGR